MRQAFQVVAIPLLVSMSLLSVAGSLPQRVQEITVETSSRPDCGTVSLGGPAGYPTPRIRANVRDLVERSKESPLKKPSKEISSAQYIY